MSQDAFEPGSIHLPRWAARLLSALCRSKTKKWERGLPVEKGLSRISPALGCKHERDGDIKVSGNVDNIDLVRVRGSNFYILSEIALVLFPANVSSQVLIFRPDTSKLRHIWIMAVLSILTGNPWRPIEMSSHYWPLMLRINSLELNQARFKLLGKKSRLEIMLYNYRATWGWLPTVQWSPRTRSKVKISYFTHKIHLQILHLI